MNKRVSLIFNTVHIQDLSEPVENSKISGMSSKSWEISQAEPYINLTDSFDPAVHEDSGIVIVEPLSMPAMASEKFNQKIDMLKEIKAPKAIWAEEQDLLRWPGSHVAEISNLSSSFFFCNKYHKKMMSAIIKKRPLHILRTPINEDFFCPLPDMKKEKKVIAMGKICREKNINGIIEVFKNLPDDFEKVYIGSAEMWGGSVDSHGIILEDRLKGYVDRWIENASKQEVADEMASAWGYFNVSVYDVGCLSFLEAAMSGCWCFAWDVHPMFDEYKDVFRFGSYEECAEIMQMVYEDSVGYGCEDIRESISKMHGYKAFRSNLQTLVGKTILGGA